MLRPRSTLRLHSPHLAVSHGAFHLILKVLLLFLSTPEIYAQQADKTPPIEPPFGLSWGETAENLQNWTKTNHYRATTRALPHSRTLIDIDGPFPDAQFSKIKATFQKNQLVEIELQFNEISKDASPSPKQEILTKSLAIKQQIDSKFGTGKMIKNETGSDKGLRWNYIEQIWTDEEHSIRLAIFTAEQPPAGSMGTASLHYRWETQLSRPQSLLQNSSDLKNTNPESQIADFSIPNAPSFLQN